MGRKAKPARIWFERSRGEWVIRRREFFRRTGFRLEERDAAERLLEKLCASPGALQRRKRKPGVSKVKKVEFGEVYFISKAGCLEYPIKIGFSLRGTYMRQKNLQVGNPEPLVIIAKAPCHYASEPLLHLILAPARKNGEWFSRLPVVMEALQAASENRLMLWIEERNISYL